MDFRPLYAAFVILTASLTCSASDSHRELGVGVATAKHRTFHYSPSLTVAENNAANRTTTLQSPASYRVAVTTDRSAIDLNVIVGQRVWFETPYGRFGGRVSAVFLPGDGVNGDAVRLVATIKPMSSIDLQKASELQGVKGSLVLAD